jgi:hypothetical protein
MIYESVMLEKFPNNGQEYIKYMQTVRMAASRGLLAMLIYKSCVKRSLYCTEFRCSYTQKPKLHVNDSNEEVG